jgi:hypothetical protein
MMYSERPSLAALASSLGVGEGKGAGVLKAHFSLQTAEANLLPTTE